MHCDLEQELGQVLGGEVDNWPTQIRLEASHFSGLLKLVTSSLRKVE